MYIPKSTVRRILKTAGACRASNDAVDMFHRHMNRTALNVAVRAVRLAKHAKRKTVDASDIKLASAN